MPLSIRELFAAADLIPFGTVRWGGRSLPDVPGVYCVSWSADPDATTVDKANYLPSPSAYAELLSVCPTLSIDGTIATPSTLSERFEDFWLPNEPILYIGKAGTSIRTRVGQYYSTRLGARSPHAGGWWLKTLEELAQVHVHFASCDEVAQREQSMLTAFAAHIAPEQKSLLFDSERVAPFANVDVTKGVYKRHGLSNYKILGGQAVRNTPAKAENRSFAGQQVIESSVPALSVQSQPVTDKDRMRSYLRIPAVSKHAFPDSNAQIRVNLDGAVTDALWRPNGTRSGTIGVGVDYMRTLEERGERLQINVSNGVYTILRK